MPKKSYLVTLISVECNFLCRSLLLQAELNCMCGKPTTALKFLFEALELAHSRSSDHYISLCLIDIASIQVTYSQDGHLVCLSVDQFIIPFFDVILVRTWLTQICLLDIASGTSSQKS